MRGFASQASYKFLNMWKLLQEPHAGPIARFAAHIKSSAFISETSQRWKPLKDGIFPCADKYPSLRGLTVLSKRIVVNVQTCKFNYLHCFDIYYGF